MHHGITGGAFMDILGLTEIGVNLALWVPGSGKVVANALTWVKDNYRDYIKPTVDRFKGLRPQIIGIKITDAPGDPSKAVFTFDKVQIIDFGAINRRIEEIDATRKAKANYALQGLSEQQIKELMEGKGEQDADTSAEADANTGIDPNLYTVAIKVPKNKAMGQIDFGDWEKQGFEITITNKEHPEQVVSPAERTKILDSLKRIPLTLGQSSVLLTPDQEVGKVTKASWDTSIKPLDTALDTLTSFWDRFKVAVGISDQRQLATGSVTPDAGQNAHLSSDAFIDGLANLVTDCPKDEGVNILDRYYGIIDQGIKNDFRLAQREKINREEEVKTRQAAKKSTTRKMIFWGIILGVVGVLAVAGIVAACVFIPPVGAALAAVGGSAVTSMVTKPSMWARFLGFFGIGLGLMKVHVECQNKLLKTAEERLVKAKKGEDALSELSKAVDQRRNNVKQALTDVHDLNDRPASRKGEDAKLVLRGQDTRDPSAKNKDPGDLELGIVCKFFEKKAGQPKNWKSLALTLSNCGITSVGADSLAKMLAKPSSNALKISEIDLTGNDIGKDGVEKIHNALQQNITLTKVSYDAFYTNAETGNKTDTISEDTKNEIAKQLLINRYLQDTSSIFLDPKKLTQDITGLDQNTLYKVFNCASNPAALLEAIRTQATEKMLKQFHVTGDNFAINPSLAYVLEQNTLLAQSRELLATQPGQALIALIGACEKAPQGTPGALARCGKFIEENKKVFSEGLEQFQRFITANPNNILELNKLAPEIRMALLKALVGDVNTDDKVDLLIKMLDKIKAMQDSSPLSEETRREIIDGTTMTAQAFLKLLPKISFHDFSVQLEELRRTIAMTSTSVDLSATQRRRSTDFLHPFLHPDVQAGSLADQKIRLNDSIEYHPDTLEDNQNALRNFIAIYKTVGLGNLGSSLQGLNLDKLKNLIKIHIDSRNQVLKQLDPSWLKALLETCFAGEPESTKKVFLISKMIETNWESSNVDSCRTLLSSAFTTGHDYNKLKQELETQRQTSKLAGAGATATTDMLDQILQADLQEELKNRFAFLRNGGQPVSSDFEALKRELNLPTNFGLRNFVFPEGIDADVKAHIEHVINRNKLHDEITVYPKEQRLEKFLAAYVEIRSPEERKKCLQEISSIDGTTLLEVIKKDVNTPYSFTELKKLDKQQMIEILEAGCLLGDRSELHAHGIAIFVSQLVMTAKPEGPIKPEYVWHIFDWTLTEGGNRRWNFDAYIRELKSLRNSTPSVATEIDTIIQRGLQADLEDRYSCLRTSSLSDFEKLQNELKNNYDLTQFEFESSHASSNVQDYIKKMINRNKVKQAFDSAREAEKLEKFLDAYFEIVSSEERQKCWQDFSAIPDNVTKLFDLVKADTYPNRCPTLQKFNKSQITEILMACHSNSHSFRDVATLASELIATNDPAIPPKYIWAIFDWDPGTFSSAHKKWDFNTYVKELKSLRDSIRNPSSATAIDKIIQAGLQAKLMTQIIDQHLALNLIRDNLEDNYDLTEYELIEDSAAAIEIKGYVKHITNRNKLIVAVSDSADQSTRLRNFSEKYFAITPDQERELCLREFKKNKGKVVLELLRNDIRNNCQVLKTLDPTQVVELLKIGLKETVRPTISNKHDHGIAVLVSQLIKIDSTELAEHIGHIFDDQRSFKQHIEDLQTLRNETNDGSLDKKISDAIQAGLQADLTNTYNCLKGMPDSPTETPSFKILQDKLEDNYDLTEFDFGTGSGVNKEVQAYVGYICARNTMLDAIKNDYENKLDLFLDSLNAIEKPPYHEKALAAIKPIDVLNLIKADVGTYERGYMGGTTVTKFSCEQLRRLNNQNPEALIALLKRCFTLDSQNSAEKKARLISQLLKIDDLFNPDNLQHNEFIKKVIENIYWSMVPGAMSRTDRAYWSFDELKQNLHRCVLASTETPVAQAIQQAIASANTLAPSAVAHKAAEVLEEEAPRPPTPVDSSTRK